MDYIIRFIGIILIVNGDSTTNVKNNTAFLPKWRTGLTFCAGAIHHIPKHEAFIRVPTAAVVTGTSWKDQKACSTVSTGSTEDCTVFFIAKTSVITIASGFKPQGPSKPGSTFDVLRRLGVADPTIELVPDPFRSSAAWLELPGGEINAEVLKNDMVSTTVHVVAPSGSTPSNMTIRAIPSGGGKTETLVVAPGTEIILGDLPREHSGMAINAVNPSPGNHNHFFLVNTLLPGGPNGHQFCSAPDLDPLCSNQGCCP